MRQFASRPVLIASGVALLAASAVAFGVARSGMSSDAPVTEPAPVTSAAPAPPADAVTAADPEDPKAVAYLNALRKADIPTSDDGKVETQVAAALCAQVFQGVGPDELASSVPLVLTGVTGDQASMVVSYATRYYC